MLTAELVIPKLPCVWSPYNSPLTTHCVFFLPPRRFTNEWGLKYGVNTGYNDVTRGGTGKDGNLEYQHVSVPHPGG